MKISQLITTFNRSVQLGRTLNRLSRLTKPDELVIVDDGSVDSTKEVVKNAEARLRIPIKYIFRDKKGYDVCSIPRNIGIKNCSHEFIAVTEPECLFITDVIKQFKEASIARPNDVISAGIVYFTNPETPIDGTVSVNPQSFIDNVWDVKKFPMHAEDRFDKDGNRIIYTQATVTKAKNMTAPFSAMYKKDWLFEIGGWDEDFSLIHGGGGYAWDDTDLLTRLRIKGHNQDINRNIKVIHQWHDRPPIEVANGMKKNEGMFMAKKLSGENERPDNPELIANKGREWGIL